MPEDLSQPPYSMAHCCRVSFAGLRTTCLFCGRALLVGRDPTEEERYVTSYDGRRMREATHRRLPHEIDSRMILDLYESFSATETFTHDDVHRRLIMTVTGAARSLRRMCQRGWLTLVEERPIPRGRIRRVYQLARLPDAEERCRPPATSTVTDDEADGADQADET